jgi:hypothetical protein
MPAEQKELAKSMQNRLSQIDAARKQYASAADASAADADSSIKRMSEELQALNTNIELRKKQILASTSDEARKQRIEQKQAELAAKTKDVEELTQQFAVAKNAADTNRAKLRDAELASDKAKSVGDSRDEAIKQTDRLQRQKEQNVREWDLKRAQLARAVEPVEPTEADVRTLGVIDNRLIYGGIASGAVFALFALWIMLTLFSAARESRYAYTPAFETLETNSFTPKGKASPTSDPETEEEPVVA